MTDPFPSADPSLILPQKRAHSRPSLLHKNTGVIDLSVQQSSIFATLTLVLETSLFLTRLISSYRQHDALKAEN